LFFKQKSWHDREKAKRVYIFHRFEYAFYFGTSGKVQTGAGRTKQFLFFLEILILWYRYWRTGKFGT
jgi:hypothetical protein